MNKTGTKTESKTQTSKKFSCAEEIEKYDSGECTWEDGRTELGLWDSNLPMGLKASPLSNRLM